MHIHIHTNIHSAKNRENEPEALAQDDSTTTMSSVFILHSYRRPLLCSHYTGQRQLGMSVARQYTISADFACCRIFAYFSKVHMLRIFPCMNWHF